ncbi:MAG: response regulator transcription factor [Acidimicrobiia bacterium]
MTTDRVLIVEDESTLAATVRFHLDREGFEVDVALDGIQGLESFRAREPDIVLLDLMLPGMPGMDVCRQIRTTSDVPVIMLTAKDSEADIVAGLEVGADDYVTKPFSMRELTARVRANLRRPVATEQDVVLTAGPLTLDPVRHEVRLEGKEVELRPKEFALLEMLLLERGRLVTRSTLLETVWGPAFYGDPKTLDVHIRRLRAKIEKDPHRPELILTVRGFGYKLADV